MNKLRMLLLSRHLIKCLAVGAVLLLGMGTTSANAMIIDWVDWTGAGTNTASGTLAGGAVSVTYTGPYGFVQNGVTGNLTNYWTEGTPAPYTNNSVVDNAPTAAEGIALNQAGSKTVTFSQAVVNPLFAFNSWNGANQGVDFGTAATILSTGAGYWGSGTITSAYGGNGWTTVSGEPHGVVQLVGTFSSITFTDTQNENWHGFTIGIEKIAGPAPVPEPNTIVLLGAGLLGIVSTRLRFKK
jgi:PEP-CTERM motif